MPRAVKLDNETMQKAIWNTIVQMKKGEISTKVGNSIISGCKAIMYGNQLTAQQKKVDELEKLVENMEQLKDLQQNGVTSLSELPPYEVKYSDLEE